MEPIGSQDSVRRFVRVSVVGLAACLFASACGPSLNQTAITCPAGRTLLDGVCVKESVADYVACVRSQGAQIDASSNQALSAEVGQLGIKAGAAAEVSDRLQRKYSASDQAILKIIEGCNVQAKLEVDPAKGPPLVANETRTTVRPNPSSTAGSATASFTRIGHADLVTAMTALDGKIWVANTNNELWVREPVLGDLAWRKAGHADAVTGLAALDGKLWATNKNNELWVREAALTDVPWKKAGHANRITGLTALAGKLWGADQNNELWFRPPAMTDLPWTKAGHADAITSLTTDGNRLLATNRNNELWARGPSTTDTPWTRLGAAPNVVGMAVLNGKLFVATKTHDLMVRDVP